MRGTKGLDAGEARRGLSVLAADWCVDCDDRQVQALTDYATLLLTWNERINLTGARSGGELLSDHFPDSFALASRLDGPERVIDVGSGGGLPAIPLAVLRRDLSLLLCEPLHKKGAFLRTAIRELGLTGRVQLDPRRGEDLVAEVPRSFDAALSRATLIPSEWLALGRQLVRASGRVFVLTTPEASLAVEAGDSVHSQTYLAGRRTLLEVRVS